MKSVFLFLIGLMTSVSTFAATLEQLCPRIPDTVVATVQCSPKNGRAKAIVLQLSERVGCQASERFSVRYKNSSPLMKANLGIFKGDGSMFIRAYKGVEEYLFFQGTSLREARFSSGAPVSAEWDCRK